MSHDLIAVGGFILLFALMLLRVPIGFSMGIAGVAGFAAVNGVMPGLNLLMNSRLIPPAVAKTPISTNIGMTDSV